MDYQKFIKELPNCYEDWGSASIRPKTDQLQKVLDQIEGMRTANILQLLNFAVDCMAEDEIYCEIGCLQGESLIGALLNHPNRVAYAVDNFSDFNLPEDGVERLANNLTEFDIQEQVFFCNQNFEEFFSDLHEVGLEEKIGVYFYNGADDYRSQLLSLLSVKPFLSDKALVILSNTNSTMARQAMLDFVATHEQCSVLIDLPTDQLFDKTFWNGICILSWDLTRSENTYQRDSIQVRHESAIESIASLALVQRQEALQTVYRDAVTLHHEGRFLDAEPKYKAFLLYESNHADAWMNLGMLYYLTLRYEEAIDALTRSLELDPARAVLYYNFGLVLEKQLEKYQAVEAYKQAILLDPKFVDAYNNLGNILSSVGEVEQAEIVYREAVAVNSGHFGSYLNLGNVLLAQHKFDEAIEAYQKALDLKHRDPDIIHSLGLAFEVKGDHTSAHKYFGYSCYRQQNYKEAADHFQRFLEVDSLSDPDIYYILANCLINLSRDEEALRVIRWGIEVHPNNPDLHYQLNYTLTAIGRTQEVLTTTSDSSLAKLNDWTLYIQNKLILPILYDSEAEIAFYRQRFTEGLQEIIQSINLADPKVTKDALEATADNTNFYLPYQGFNDRDLQKEYGQLVHNIMAANYPKWAAKRPMPPLGQNGKIRVGYVSEQLFAASGSRWALGWLQHCDRSQFEIYCYNTGSKADPKTQQFRLLSDVFHHIPDNLEATCQQILRDQLHVLVFLAIGMSGKTMQLAALQLAPVQCTAWGHPITSGLPTVDYFLSGELIESENAQEYYTEKLVRLSNLGISYPKPLVTEPTKKRSDFQLSNDAVIYLSCQHTSKYLPQYDYLFAEIAQRVPRAKFVFVLKPKPSTSLEQKFRDRLAKAFATANLKSEDYCVFLPMQDWHSYTSLMQVSDILLDTLSYSGGHTTFDAVACKLPIVTCPSEFMRGRQSYGILKMLGVTDTIAQNEAEYIEIAARLGLDPEWRQDIAQRMEQRQSYLFEDKSCVTALEQFYKQVVQEQLTLQAATPTTSSLLIPQFNSAKKTVLHVGCGPDSPERLHETFHTNEWQEVRLDIDPSVQPDLIGSITDMSAVPSESVDAVWSSHNVEHLDHYQVPTALVEFYRVLKPGGFALITLPDLQAVAKHVAQGKLEDPLYMSAAGPIAAIDIIYGLGTAIAQGNYYMAHRTGFTAETLKQKLEDAGFSDVEVSSDDYLALWAKGFKK